MPQVKLAREKDLLSIEICNRFDKFYNLLPSLLPDEKPALLHGDLWSGNLITDSKGAPSVIDPAVYYGNREIEIAFTKLFGGFNDEFYNTYQSILPLQNGFESRIDLYNLYPLLVHVNLFGGTYVQQVVSIIKKFV